MNAPEVSYDADGTLTLEPPHHIQRLDELERRFDAQPRYATYEDGKYLDGRIDDLWGTFHAADQRRRDEINALQRELRITGFLWFVAALVFTTAIFVIVAR